MTDPTVLHAAQINSNLSHLGVSCISFPSMVWQSIRTPNCIVDYFLFRLFLIVISDSFFLIVVRVATVSCVFSEKVVMFY